MTSRRFGPPYMLPGKPLLRRELVEVCETYPWYWEPDGWRTWQPKSGGRPLISRWLHDRGHRTPGEGVEMESGAQYLEGGVARQNWGPAVEDEIRRWHWSSQGLRWGDLPWRMGCLDLVEDTSRLVSWRPRDVIWSLYVGDEIRVEETRVSHPDTSSIWGIKTRLIELARTADRWIPSGPLVQPLDDIEWDYAIHTAGRWDGVKPIDVTIHRRDRMAAGVRIKLEAPVAWCWGEGWIYSRETAAEIAASHPELIEWVA